MTQEKTKEFLHLVLNKINPKVFINILVQYVENKLFVRDGKEKQRFRILTELVEYITVILAYSERNQQVINSLLFESERQPEVFAMWSFCPQAILKASLLCKRFDFCRLILEREVTINLQDPLTVLSLDRYIEEMLCMIDSNRFAQIMNHRYKAEQGNQLLRLVCTFVMMTQNNKKHIDLIKKLKLKYWSDDQSLQTHEISSQDKDLYDLYCRTRDSSEAVIRDYHLSIDQYSKLALTSLHSF